MSNEFHVSEKLRNAALVGMAGAAETGASAVTCLIYALGSGIPANLNVVITDQPLLATHVSNLGVDGFEDTASVGSLNANAFDDVVAALGGDPAFFRILDANGEVCMQGTAGTSGTHMIVSDGTYVQGGNSSITGFAVGMPANTGA